MNGGRSDDLLCDLSHPLQIYSAPINWQFEVLQPLGYPDSALDLLKLDYTEVSHHMVCTASK